jgi:hypothetical protein
MYLCLGCHTGERLLKEYETITAQYGIEEKVVRLITDNASNNIKAFGSLIVPGFEPYFEGSSDDLLMNKMMMRNLEVTVRQTLMKLTIGVIHYL